MTEKVEKVLVQGTVTFTVSCNELLGLVDPEVANSGYQLKNWLQDKAVKLLDSASVEVEIDYDETVIISKETAEKHTGSIISSDDWKSIMKENKSL